MKRKGLIELAQFDMEHTQAESIYATGSRYVVLAEQKGEILVLTLFDAKKKEEQRASVVVFQTKDDYVSLQLVDGVYKWRTGALKNILNFGWYSANYGAYQNGSSVKCWLKTHEQVIKEFTGAKESDEAIKSIFALQDEILAHRLEMKHKKLTDKWDKQMEIVPELPEDFEKWIDNVPLGHSRYLVYKRNKRDIEGFCTHCRQYLSLPYAKHGEKGKCPVCGTTATYKAKGKAKRIEDGARFSIMQRVVDHDGEQQVLIRTFYAGRDFKYEKLTNPKTHITEKVRSFYRLDGAVRDYEYNLFRQRTERWNDENFWFNDRYVVLYEKNVKEVLSGTIWQYAAIDIMAERGKLFNLRDFMEHYPRNKKIEYVVKAGLYTLAKETITSYRYSNGIEYPNYQAKSVKDFLGVGMELMPQLQRLDVNLDQFRLVQRAYEKGIRLTDEQVIWAEQNLTPAREILNATTYTTVHKAIKYIAPFMKENSHAYRDWLDYLSMCEKLQYDMKNTFVLFPKDLKQAHDGVTKLIKYRKDKAYDKAIKSMSTELESLYAFNDGTFSICIPKNSKQILNESNSLHHCVKNYISTMAEGRTVILFVRKTDDPHKPFYTLEVKSGDIAQCRGYRNEGMTKEVKRFIDKFKKAKLLAKSKTMSA